MRRVVAFFFLIMSVGCSSKGDSVAPQDASGAGGAAESGGSSAPAGGTLASGGQSASTGGMSGTGGQSAASGGATGSGGRPGTDAGSGAHTNPLSQALIDEFVTAHNNARSGTVVALNPPPSPALPLVSWDPILADSAYNYLTKCQSAAGSLVDHNANRSSDYVALGGSGYVGENIYAMQGAAATPTAAVALWMGEASSYDYATNSGNAGHYTQVVWRSSVRIGCAIVTCPALKYSNSILCDYSPGGNISGQKPY
jgi:pathogenesis-related protein 1